MIELDHVDYIPREDLIDKDPFAGFVALYERTGELDTDDFAEFREWMQDTGIPVALDFSRNGKKVTALQLRTRDQEDADAFIARWL
jgi:hypothetical protein